MGNGQIRQVEYEQGEGRQFRAKTGKSFGKLGHHLDQKNTGYHDSDRHNRNGVVHGFFDLGFQSLGFFLVGGQAIQHGLQGTGLLTGINQVAEQVIKITRMFANTVGEIITGGHIVPD